MTQLIVEKQAKPVTRTCSGCKYFTQSNNFPLIGSCQQGGQVMAGDRACGFAV